MADRSAFSRPANFSEVRTQAMDHRSILASRHMQVWHARPGTTVKVHSDVVRVYARQG